MFCVRDEVFLEKEFCWGLFNFGCSFFCIGLGLLFEDLFFCVESRDICFRVVVGLEFVVEMGILLD